MLDDAIEVASQGILNDNEQQLNALKSKMKRFTVNFNGLQVGFN